MPVGLYLVFSVGALDEGEVGAGSVEVVDLEDGAGGDGVGVVAGGAGWEEAEDKGNYWDKHSQFICKRW